jgi:hypothetical protein
LGHVAVAPEFVTFGNWHLLCGQNPLDRDNFVLSIIFNFPVDNDHEMGRHRYL